MCWIALNNSVTCRACRWTDIASVCTVMCLCWDLPHKLLFPYSPPPFLLLLFINLVHKATRYLCVDLLEVIMQYRSNITMPCICVHCYFEPSLSSQCLSYGVHFYSLCPSLFHFHLNFSVETRWRYAFTVLHEWLQPSVLWGTCGLQCLKKLQSNPFFSLQNSYKHKMF